MSRGEIQLGGYRIRTQGIERGEGAVGFRKLENVQGEKTTLRLKSQGKWGRDLPRA